MFVEDPISHFRYGATDDGDDHDDHDADGDHDDLYIMGAVCLSISKVIISATVAGEIYM